MDSPKRYSFVFEGLRDNDAQSEMHGLHNSEKMQHHSPNRIEGKKNGFQTRLLNFLFRPPKSI